MRLYCRQGFIGKKYSFFSTLKSWRYKFVCMFWSFFRVDFELCMYIRTAHFFNNANQECIHFFMKNTIFLAHQKVESINMYVSIIFSYI